MKKEKKKARKEKRKKRNEKEEEKEEKNFRPPCQPSSQLATRDRINYSPFCGRNKEPD